MTLIWEHATDAPDALQVALSAETNDRGYTPAIEVSERKLALIMAYVDAMEGLGRSVLMKRAEDDDGKPVLSFCSVPDDLGNADGDS